MALTGLDIYKLLPKTNCGECKSPTCLAFAMRVAQKQASLDQCPHVTAEAKEKLGAASAPPIQLVTIGTGDAKVSIGNETVMFRHEETFHHKAGVAVTMSDKLSEADIAARADKIVHLIFERVGTRIAVDMVCVMNDSNDPAKFAAATKIVAEKCPMAIILGSENPDALKAALDVCADRRPLLCGATAANVQAVAALAKEKNCPVVAKADGLEALAELTQKISAAGVKEIVLYAGEQGVRQTLEDLTKVRRYALKKTFRPLGYPQMVCVMNGADPLLTVLKSSTFMAKYAGIVVTDAIEPWQLMPLLTVRMNIYTDPRSPIQVESGIHRVGETTDKSPLMITTNFSLTYYTVEGDVESSKVPTNILVVDTEGTSVLTAWAAEKFTTDQIAAAMKKHEVEKIAPHKKVIIPGLIAVESGKLQEETGWEVVVGPKESSGIPSYLKANWGS
ncbi:MAG: acetyl-CoA decarbonylase/synthase complex subunit gamma [Candidatus Abyssobacteria bacterium SURF_5]|uniref:Acetyl-CoA decarbonylase/synthase complex subunit gamma n=1 Tax=Abyssobacteria bacterium (strain SURF_5) TaxID=2093360 RepID=A0A3A4NRS8_ABYX5|nr:MAG: acetyl-CoA decarbonylase/synthase complex subunit gamma [Candidatus Abyssubacteria bacterium SURF_5]